jgi:ribosomal protein S18 acetylase RimI-like enzyme
VGEPLKAVAYWLEPGKSDISISIRAIGSFLPLIFTFYPLGYIRARQVLKTTDELHQQYAGEPHYYLDNIGVLPAEQGRGLSSRLIRPFFERADDEKVLVYTETVTSRNVPFYEHFGFECMESRSIQKTGITIYALCRPVQ